MAIQGIETKKLFDSVSENCELSVEWHGYVETDVHWKQNILLCPWTRLYFVLDGEGEFIYNGGSMKIEPGYAYLAPCGLPYGYRGKPSVKKLFFHVNLTMPDGRELFASPDMKIVRFKRSKEKLERMLEWYRSDDRLKHLLLKSEIWRAVSDAITELDSDLEMRNYSETVLAAISYVRENLSAGLKTGEVAEAVFCSVGTLNERFKGEVGMTVARYIEDRLMLEARRLLVSDEKKSIGDVSAQLGYCDQFYFSRRFTQYFSVTPRDYRKLRGAT